MEIEKLKIIDKSTIARQKNSNFLLIAIFEVLVLVVSFFYIQLWADKVAVHVGYPSAMYIVPTIVSAVFAVVLSKIIEAKGLLVVKIVLMSVVLSVTPVSIFLLLVTFATGPL